MRFAGVRVQVVGNRHFALRVERPSRGNRLQSVQQTVTDDKLQEFAPNPTSEVINSPRAYGRGLFVTAFTEHSVTNRQSTTMNTNHDPLEETQENPMIVVAWDGVAVLKNGRLDYTTGAMYSMRYTVPPIRLSVRQAS